VESRNNRKDKRFARSIEKVDKNTTKDARQIITEIKCTADLQKRVDFANSHTLENFSLRLVMEPKQRNKRRF
jgi:hypothetical protein